jgi:hypothetical protein
MPRRRRNSPEGVDRAKHWLGSEQRARSRPWEYEEFLFGSGHGPRRIRELAAVVWELERERFELARLHQELDEHLTRIANLQSRLDELTPAGEPDTSPSRASPNPLGPRAARTEEIDSAASLATRNYSFARCEGFQVDSPTGPVGFVEGVRFVTRIDEPDLLEVRAGRFGRELVLIPTEQVVDVRQEEGLIVVRSRPTPSTDLLHELGARLSRALHFHQPTS